MIVHLAGFVHGPCDYEGAIPVELSVADFGPMTNQSVDTSEVKMRIHEKLFTDFTSLLMTYMWKIDAKR